MSDFSNRPLLTFAIAAYNQEAFVREAVEGAFAQTYSPLEVILSDDCSGDRTFEIMREMAAAYGGPHQVLLNRNPVRCSIGGHVNRVVEISHGELIVGAAGDDISLPDRTQAAYEVWEKSGQRATSIHSNYFQIDDKGKEIGKVHEEASAEVDGLSEQKVDALAYVKTLQPIVFGCTHTFSRELFRVFGPLPHHIIHEDNALALRSILAGKLFHIRRPLVKYRVHGNNIYIKSRARAADLKTLERQEEWLKRSFANREAMYEGFLIDLQCARRKALLSRDQFDQAFALAARNKLRFSLQKQFLSGGIFTKIRILALLWRQGLNPQEKQTFLRRLLPHAIMLRLRLLSGYAAARRRSGSPEAAASPSA